MPIVEFTLEAERDLIEIYLYGVSTFGPRQAERYSALIQAKIEVVAEHPDFGADYGFVRHGLRRYEAVSHAIY